MMPWTKLNILWENYLNSRRERTLRDIQVRLNLYQIDNGNKIRSLEVRVQALGEANQRLRQEVRSLRRDLLTQGKDKEENDGV